MFNLLNGPLPNRLFWGIQTMDSYAGSINHSSTRFNQNGLIKVNLYIDGKEIGGFPVSMTDAHVVQPYVKYLENTNQQLNGFLSRTLSFEEFQKYSFILSQAFDQSDSGSLSFEFEFGSAVNTDLVLITCEQYNRTIKIDHNRNFQIQ